MEALRQKISYKHYLTLHLYCRVFVLSKTKNGYYKCHLIYQTKDENETFIEWVIPKQYLEENGHYVQSQDIYFARWLLTTAYDVVKDENGNEELKQYFRLGRMINFWNTRIFGKEFDL